MILFELISFNSNIKVDSKPVNFSFFSDKILNLLVNCLMTREI